MPRHLNLYQKDEEIRFFENIMDNVNILVDIGCRQNHYYYDLKPSAKNYLFDVCSFHTDRLKEDIGDSENVFIFPFGLSDTNSSVFYDDASESIHRSGHEAVEIKKFDDVMSELGIIDKIDFLKIDIEGSEPEILKFTEVLKNIKYIQWEFGPHWPNRNQYDIDDVVEQYKDTHDFYYMKDDQHPSSKPEFDLLQILDEDLCNSLKHYSSSGCGGNMVMVAKYLRS